MRYASIRKMDISNGEGVGISLFVQGCPYHCKGCFNPETWDFNGGKEWTKELETQFVQMADKPQIKRISILGGEPLCNENVQDVWYLIEHIKEYYNDPNGQKQIWVYTGGIWENFIHYISMPDYTSLNIMETTEDYNKRKTYYKILSNIDVLVDGSYIHKLRDITLPFRGSSNQRIIDVQKSLKNNKVVLWEPK